MRLKLLIIFSFVFITACFKEKRSGKAGEKMQDFVIQISKYARIFNPHFIVIPQNGAELGFQDIDPANEVNQHYLNAIDAFGTEELFYNGPLAVDYERLPTLQKLKKHKRIMVADFVDDNANISDVIARNDAEGFMCFPRNSTDYDYTQIPDSVWHENNYAIHDLKSAQNYLYLISTDNFSSKQEMINAIKATNFDLVIIDLFFNDEMFSKEEILQLKTKANGAHRLVISYMNIGSAEKFRYYWKKTWGVKHPLWIKRKYEGYDDEFWVKYWKKDWEEIIYGNKNSYTKKIIDAGFDGAYLDNVEAYYFLYYKD